MIPKVLVLLASFNGQEYISEQINSILNQIGVDVVLCVSDDGSSDDTLSLVLAAAFVSPDRIFLLQGCRPRQLAERNAANNFYHLISSVVIPQGTCYLALSDQDDVWDPLHLFVATAKLKNSVFSGYSSSVLAFWPSGRRRHVKKCGYISRYNHLFESPGPGCSFVLPLNSFSLFQVHLLRSLDIASRIHFHDWAIFAYVRSIGGDWIIDSWPSLLYRQHDSNVLGVKLTARSIIKRLGLLLDGWYHDQCLAVAEFVGQRNVRPARLLRRFSVVDRFSLAWLVFCHRRRLRDKILLPFALLLMLPSSRRLEPTGIEDLP